MSTRDRNPQSSSRRARGPAEGRPETPAPASEARAARNPHNPHNSYTPTRKLHPRALTARAGMAEKGFDACLVAVRSYVDSAALPVSEQDRQTAAELGDQPRPPEVREVSESR